MWRRNDCRLNQLLAGTEQKQRLKQEEQRLGDEALL